MSCSVGWPSAVLFERDHCFQMSVTKEPADWATWAGVGGESLGHCCLAPCGRTPALLGSHLSVGPRLPGPSGGQFALEEGFWFPALRAFRKTPVCLTAALEEGQPWPPPVRVAVRSYSGLPVWPPRGAGPPACEAGTPSPARNIHGPQPALYLMLTLLTRNPWVKKT